jgi:hypothetical protein
MPETTVNDVLDRLRVIHDADTPDIFPERTLLSVRAALVEAKRKGYVVSRLNGGDRNKFRCWTITREGLEALNEQSWSDIKNAARYGEPMRGTKGIPYSRQRARG